MRLRRIGCCVAACVIGLGLMNAPAANAGGPTPSACLADIDGDGQVGLGDIAIIIQFWGQTVNCDDGNPCTEDFCIDGLCFHIPVQDGAPCNDNNPCTLNDRCVAGTCMGVPIHCPPGTVCINGNCVINPN
jgi:hypothetical protein